MMPVLQSDSAARVYEHAPVQWVSEWVSGRGLTSPSTHYRSLQRRASPVTSLLLLRLLLLLLNYVVWQQTKMQMNVYHYPSHQRVHIGCQVRPVVDSTHRRHSCHVTTLCCRPHSLTSSSLPEVSQCRHSVDQWCHAAGDNADQSHLVTAVHVTPSCLIHHSRLLHTPAVAMTTTAVYRCAVANSVVTCSKSDVIQVRRKHPQFYTMELPLSCTVRYRPDRQHSSSVSARRILI